MSVRFHASLTSVCLAGLQQQPWQRHSTDSAGTLLHEIVHARTGFDDVTCDFENALTEVIGQTAAAAPSTVPTQKSFLSDLFGRV